MTESPAQGQAVRSPRAAVYMHNYLGRSQTFIYRQLAQLRGWQPLVMTVTTRNLQFFPWKDLVVHGSPRSARLRDAAQRRLFKRAPRLTRGQRRAFRQSLLNAHAVLVHAHFGPAGIEILPLARELGIPLLVTFHGFDASTLLREKWYVSGLKELFEYAYVIAVSETMGRRLIKYGAPAERVYPLHIGVPLDSFRYISRPSLAQKVRRGEVLSLLQVANFVEKKGHLYTLRAFSRLREVYPKIRLVLGGDGPLRVQAQLLARELGLGDNVQFLGTVDEDAVRRLMAAADVFVHHSVTAANGAEEGIPTVVMEAMASGLPVVSTLHAGIPELVQDGVTGYLVGERDVEKYFERLVDVLSDDGSMGRAGRDRVEQHFDLNVQTHRLDALYRNILNGYEG